MEVWVLGIWRTCGQLHPSISREVTGNPWEATRGLTVDPLGRPNLSSHNPLSHTIQAPVDVDDGAHTSDPVRAEELKANGKNVPECSLGSFCLS